MATSGHINIQHNTQEIFYHWVNATSSATSDVYISDTSTNVIWKNQMKVVYQNSTLTSDSNITYTNDIWTNWTATSGDYITQLGGNQPIAEPMPAYDPENPEIRKVWKTWVSAFQTPAAAVAANAGLEGAPTIEQIEELRRERKLDSANRKRRQRQIDLKAFKLLKALVSEEQWEDYLEHGSVRLETEKAIYDVGTGWSGMVYELSKEGEPLRKLCRHPGFGYPTADRIAAVLLELMADEDAYVTAANKHHFSDAEKVLVKAWEGHIRSDSERREWGKTASRLSKVA